MTIKELRNEAKMTQQEFSEFLGIPRRTIEDWDSGKSSIKDYMFNLIEEKLINEGLVADATLNNNLDSGTVKVIENAARNGREMVALKRYAKRYGASFDEANIPFIWSNTSDIDVCVKELIDNDRLLKIFDEEENVEEAYKKQEEFYRSRADVENGCVIIRAVD